MNIYSNLMKSRFMMKLILSLVKLRISDIEKEEKEENSYGDKIYFPF